MIQGAAATAPRSYDEAFDATAQTIRLRASRYRNLVVAVIIVALGSIGLALVHWSWPPLLWLLMLLPLCGLFLWLDARLIARWQQWILGGWVEGKLELATYSDAMRMVPALPRSTLLGMLASLPPMNPEGRPEQISAVTRRAVMVVAAHLQAWRSVQHFLWLVAQLVVSGATALALLEWSLSPLLLLAGVPLIVGICRGFAFLRFRSCARQVSLLHQAGLQIEELHAVAAKLDWQGVPMSIRRTVLELPD